MAKLQLLVDGTNSNTATIALGYAGGIVAAANQEQIEDEHPPERSPDYRSRHPRRAACLVQSVACGRSTTWCRGSFASLLMEMMVPLTAFSLVRERERGTIEQLMVTPLRAGEVLIGKTIPYIVIGLVDAALILTAGTLWFGVPLPLQHGGAVRVHAPVHRGRAGSGDSRGDICQHAATGCAERAVRSRSQHSAFRLHVPDRVDAGRRCSGLRPSFRCGTSW